MEKTILGTMTSYDKFMSIKNELTAALAKEFEKMFRSAGPTKTREFWNNWGKLKER